MEPITIASLIGLGLAGGVGGFVAGRRTAPEPDEPAHPTEPTSDPRVEELDRENRMLRRLTGLESPRMIGSGGLLGEHKGYFESQLAELVSSNTVKAAAFFGPDGLVVAGDDRRQEVQTLAAVFSGVDKLEFAGANASRTVWSDDRGNRFEFHRVVKSGERPIYLGVWTLSVQPPRSVIARIKYSCSGLKTVGDELAQRPAGLRLTEPAERELFEPIVSTVDVFTIGVLGLEGTVAHAEAANATGIRGGLRDVLRRIARLGTFVDTIGDETTQLLVELESGRTLGFHPLETSDGHIALLYMEIGAGKEYPEDRMDKWSGQLAWRLPGIDIGGSETTNDDAPVQSAGGAA